MKLVVFASLIVMIAVAGTYLRWYFVNRFSGRYVEDFGVSKNSLDMALLLKELLAADEQMPVFSRAQRSEAERLVTEYFGKRPRGLNQGDS